MWEKPLYIAKRNGKVEDKYGKEQPTFDKPKKYSFNYQPTYSNVDYSIYGTLINQMFVAFIDYNYAGKIQEGDLAYLLDNQTRDVDELANKDSDDEFCNNANYRIKTMLPQNLKIKVTFEKIINGNGGSQNG